MNISRQPLASPDAEEFFAFINQTISVGKLLGLVALLDCDNAALIVRFGQQNLVIFAKTPDTAGFKTRLEKAAATFDGTTIDLSALTEINIIEGKPSELTIEDASFQLLFWQAKPTSSADNTEDLLALFQQTLSAEIDAAVCQQQLIEAQQQNQSLNEQLEQTRRQNTQDKEFLDAMMDSLTEGIVACDANGKLATFNEKTRQLHGVDVREIPSSQWANYYSLYDGTGEQYISEQQIPLIRAFNGERVVEEILVIAPAGQQPHVLVCNGMPIISSSGEKLGAVVAMRDITALRRSEKNLQDMQNLLMLASRHAQLGAWSYTLADQKLVWSNDTAEIHGEEAGFSPDLATALNYYIKADQARLTQAFEKCCRLGEAFDLELQLITKQGQQIWVRSSGEPMRDEYGNILSIYGAVQNIHHHKIIDKERKQTSERLQMIAGRLPGVIFEFRLNADDSYLMPYASDYLYEIFRVTPATVKHDARVLLKRVYEPDRAALCESIRTSANNLQMWTHEFRLIGRNNQLNWISGNAVPQPQADGSTLWFGFITDITQTRKDEEERKLLQAALTKLNDIVLITEAGPINEPGPRVVFVNDAFEKITGYQRSEIIGQTPRILQGPKTQRDELNKIRYALENWQAVRAEVINYTKSGEPIWLEIDMVPMADDSGWYTHWIAVERDISSRKIAQEKIHQLAFYDSLTSLPNRQLLIDRLKSEIVNKSRQADCSALLFIDLDNFKVLNDTLGHQIGDQLLTQVAQRLLLCVRSCDTVSRFGGDEFVVLLRNLSETPEDASQQAYVIAEKILDRLNQEYRFAGAVHHSSPSIGITLIDTAANNSDEVLKCADLAMYQAKAVGKNTIRFYDPSMQNAINERAELEKHLRNALQNQQFVLFYQAQVDQDGRVWGAEALIRWQQPERGFISPAEFIPLAEDTKLILPLGDWILKTACEQLVKWAADPQSRHLTLSVNVSAVQFQHPNFVDDCIEIIRASGADPTLLKFELTEGLLVNDVKAVASKMKALGEIGVSFALDDFGTGYSSLSYLKQLPLDQLKIDQSFVRDMLIDNNDAMIARTIVALGKSLELDVVAEGVETEEQRQCLQSYDCNHFQGYLFARPMTAEAFTGLLGNVLPSN